MHSHKEKKFTKIIALIMAAALAFSGCGSSGTAAESSSQAGTQEASSYDDEFLEFTEELFTDTLLSDTISLHYTLAYPEEYGITDYAVVLEPWSEEGYEADIQDTNDALDALLEFDRDELSYDNQLTYDILTEYLETSLTGTEFEYYEEVFAPITGLQANIHITMSEYAFRTQRDIEDYLKLMELLPTYMESFIEYEEIRAEKGFVMPDSSIDDVVAGIEEFLSSGEENVYITSFEERLDDFDGLTDAEKEEYITANNDIVNDQIFPVYQDIIDCLEKIRGTGENSRGLVYTDGGADYYGYLIKSTVGSGHTADELITLIEGRIEDDINEMVSLLMQDSELTYLLYEDIPESRTPEEILYDLQAAIEDDYPGLPADATYEIKYVPDYMNDISSPAFYMIPPIDAASENTIYINSNQTDESELFATLAHEGYPGHLYQVVYFSATMSDPVRRLLSYSGYTEGWGFYAEHEAYAMNSALTDLSEDLAEVLKLNSTITYAVYALADLCINYLGYTVSEAGELFSDYFGTLSDDIIQSIYDLIVSEPTYYLEYYVGYMEICLLREKAETTLGDSFDLKEFHTFFLDMGPCSFTVLETYMDEWMESRG